MHFRLRAHAHLPGGTVPLGSYHFGTSVYVSKDEAGAFLNDIWTQPLDEGNPELGLRPIICLQQGASSTTDLRALVRDIGFDPAKMGATIAMLDSQVIAGQTRIAPNLSTDIHYLLAQFDISPCKFENCGNIAAYITIVSMLSALRELLYLSPKDGRFRPSKVGPSASITAQSVVDRLAEYPTPAPPLGQKIYCHRCGDGEHVFADCPNTDFVCGFCLKSPIPWKRENATTHREGICIFFPHFRPRS